MAIQFLRQVSFRKKKKSDTYPASFVKILAGTETYSFEAE